MTLTANAPFTFEANTIGALDVDTLSSTNSIFAFVEINTGDFFARIIQNDETLGATFTIVSGEAGIGGGHCGIAALSSTKAICCWVRSSGDGGGVGLRILNISGTTITAPGSTLYVGAAVGTTSLPRICALSSTSAILVYDDVTVGSLAVLLSISGNAISSVDSVDYASLTSYGPQAVVELSSTKAMVAWRAGAPNFELQAAVLNVTGGTSLTAGAIKNVDGTDFTSTLGLARISSSKALVAYNNSTEINAKAVVLSVVGTTITVNTYLIFISGNIIFGSSVGIAQFNSSNYVLTYRNNSGDVAATWLTLSGNTLTDQGDITVDSINSGSTIHSATAFGSSQAITGYSGSGIGAILNLDVGGLTLAPAKKPCDIDADGTFIYISALNNSFNPILIKISTALNADGSVVFEPGSGSNIGVQCGRGDANVIWVGGIFDGTNTVEKSEDAGSTFTVKDGALFTDVRTFVVGPDNDSRVLLIDDDTINVAVQETTDDGANWTQRRADTGFDVLDIARLGINVQECVFGNVADVNDNIDYSPNSGIDMEDYTTGNFPEQDVNKVIVN